MIKIGLTGGIGSGKSMVARIFEIIGAPVYHADAEAKRLMSVHPGLRKDISSLFGHNSYQGDKVNTIFLASVVFSDPEKLSLLNKLIHPVVRSDFLQWQNSQKNSKYVIEEAAILFESGHYKDFDFTILVFAEQELRIKRVMHRDSVSREAVLNRIKQQMPDKDKRKLCDFEISNNENDLILNKVLSLHNKFISLQR